MAEVRDHVDGGRLVLRPAPRNWIQQTAIFLWVPTVLLGLLFAGISLREDGPVVAAILIAPIVVGIALTWASFRSKRIVVTPDEIAQLGLFIRKRGQRAQAVRLVRAHIIQPRARVYDTVFVLDRAGKPIIRIYGHIYDRADMDRLVEFLGLPCDGPDRLVLATELDAMHPGIVPWRQARPAEFAIVGVSIVVGFSVILTIVLQVVLL